MGGFPLAWTIVALTAVGRGGDDPAKATSFRERIAPILVKKCLGCHDDRKAESGLNMKTFALLKRGGKGYGAEILVPGDPESSGLVQVVGPDAEPRMPLKQPALGDDEIRAIETWVREGAKFDGGAEGETTLTSLVDPLVGLPKVALRATVLDAVTSAAFAPNGKVLAAATGKDVVLWDLSSARKIATLAGRSGPVTAVRISSDGRTLIAAGGLPGMSGAVVVWDLEKKTRTHELRGHSDAILSADLSPDGKTLATASYDRLVKLWDVESGKEIRSLKEHSDAVYDVAFSPDGRSLASVSGDRTVKVWDVTTGKRRVTLSDSTAELNAVVFAPDGKTVLAGGVDRSIRAWEVVGESGALTRSAFAHDAAIIRLARSLDGQTLLSSGEDRAIKVWDLATLKPRASFTRQSDWPLALALSPDGSRIAVGRYDGSLALLDSTSEREVLAMLEPPGAAGLDPKTGKPRLITNATLNQPSPRGGTRGSTIKVVLSGNGVGEAREVAFVEPGIEPKITKSEKSDPDPNRLEVEFKIAPDAPARVYRFVVRTPLGAPASQAFAVSADPELSEAEPNDQPNHANAMKARSTLVGAIDRPGDVDHFRFDADAETTVVFEALGKPLGSAWDGELAVIDETGKVLGSATDSDASPDPYLAFKAARSGSYVLRVTDQQFGGSGNHFYRIRAGVFGSVERVRPLGVSLDSIPIAGASKFEAVASSSAVSLQGPNLISGEKVALQVTRATEAGTLLPIVYKPSEGSAIRTDRKVVVADGAQIEEPVNSPREDTLGQAIFIATPGGATGMIETPGDVDLYRFKAVKGQPLIVEIHGRRLGTTIDSAIEVLDLQGHVVPRAVLRPVEETAVAFRDHPSGGRNIRLTQWNDFAEGDFVLIGRELTRIFELPRNPDDDAIFWGLGTARSKPGDRIAFLGTTPEHHPLAQPIYKVELHPPGSMFPPGGVPPVTLFYRNDDGGPDCGKDSKLTFDPPADGEYLVRVSDVRGVGGPQTGYHLAVRRPKPDFRLSLSTENPNVPRGGATVVTVNATRIDGFEGPIDVSVEGLPPGVTAAATRIEPEVYAAELLVMADASAPAFSPATWNVSGVAASAGSAGETISHTIDPGGPNGGWITVTPEPNLKVDFRPRKLVIRPGERVEMRLSVERGPAFEGRVPIDVRNLPRGVRVENIGLNGVLVTEKQTERSIVVYAEPWALPQERFVFAVGKCEPANTEHASAPIPLVVESPAPASRTTRTNP
jgi:WD40 repeat protein